MSVKLSTAEGPIALAETYLGNMVADSARFRTITGASDRTTALNRIHFGALPPPAVGGTFTRSELEKYRPYAVIYTDEDEGFRRVLSSVSDHNNYDDHGAVMMVLEMDVAENTRNNPAEVARAFINIMGVLLDEMVQMSGQAGYLDVQTMAVEFGPARSHEEDYSKRGDYVSALMRFTY